MIKILTHKRNIEFLFLAWLLSLPFGTSIGSLSIGFLTIYPNLLLSFALLIPLPFVLKKWARPNIIFLAFISLWLVSAVIFAFYKGKSEIILFDIRSLIMQLIFTLLLFTTYSILGWTRFKELLIIGLRCFLFVLLAFGLFEFYTGNHLEGNTSAKLYYLPVNFIFYAPLFVYDNPNDFLLYCLFILVVLLIFDDRLRTNRFVPVSIALLLALFTICAYSRLSNFLITIIVCFQIFQVILDVKKRIEIKRYIPYAIVFALMVIVLLINPVFVGPKYLNANKFQRNGLDITLTDSLILNDNGTTIGRKSRLVKYNEPSADEVRLNLTLNGLDLIRENPILGVGPGQFRQRHINHEVKRRVGTVVSPHNFVIEVLSQYGIIGWGYFIFVFYLAYELVLKKRSIARNNKNWFIIVFVSLPVFWLMPSAYLYLNIHWLFLPLLLIELNRIQVEENAI